MALSEDQKAMLRLLAQREQGYEDLAALMGLSVDEVRERVAAALAQLEAEGEPVPPIEPPVPAAAPEPEPPATAPEPREPAPASEENPLPPVSAAEEPKQAAAAAGSQQARPKLSLPRDRGVRAAIGAGLLALVAVVVLLIVGGSGGSSGAGSSASGASGSATTAAAENSQLTQAVLSPVAGGEGEGRAFFGRVGKNAALQVEATGLAPSPKGSAYTIWLYKTPKLALRVGAVRVGKAGGLAVRLPIPSELLGYVASGALDQIDVALTEDSAYAAEVASSKKEKKLPEHVGDSVLRGEITGPITEAAAKER